MFLWLKSLDEQFRSMFEENLLKISYYQISNNDCLPLTCQINLRAQMVISYNDYLYSSNVAEQNLS